MLDRGYVGPLQGDVRTKCKKRYTLPMYVFKIGAMTTKVILAGTSFTGVRIFSDFDRSPIASKRFIASTRELHAARCCAGGRQECGAARYPRRRPKNLRRAFKRDETSGTLNPILNLRRWEGASSHAYH